MANFAVWQKYLHLAKETTWGTLPGSPTYVHIPFATYDVKVRPEASQADLFTGLRLRRHNRIAKATLTGSLQCPLFSYHDDGMSVAERLIGWLISAPDNVDLDSHVAEIHDADADNKRHLGLRPASGTISGSSDSGVIDLSLQLEGKQEIGGITSQALDPASPRPTEFLFKDATFTVNSIAVQLQSFEISISNNAQVYHNNSYWPSLISAGVREITFAFSIFKTDDTFDVMRRTPPGDGSAQLVLLGAHDGTGPPATNFTRITIDLSRLAFVDATESGGLNDLQSQDLDYVVLKPTNASNEIGVTFDATA